MRDKNHIRLAQKIWDYHHMNHTLKKCNCILVFGSHDERVAKRWAELFLEWYAPYILFSWWKWRLTEDRDISEADKFAKIARNMWVPESSIIIENKSTNSEENVKFSMNLLQEQWIETNSLLVIHKPYMERRAFATFKKHFPDQHLIISSQECWINDYISDIITIESLINLIVWDLHRIIVYPKKWFQIEQDVPKDVIEAMNLLIDYWYNHCLVK